MHASHTLPENYSLAWCVDVKNNRRLNLILQGLALLWMALAAGLLGLVMVWLRPDFYATLSAGASGNPLISLLLVLGVMFATISLHELTHGLFFWLFARKRPEFGIGPGYAFAAMPDWFFPRQEYLVIALAPLVLLTLLGLLASLFAPLAWLGWLLIAMAIKAGGAIGDMYICWRIAREDRDVWIKDTGDGFQLYRRGQ